jgi:hypothetical protein
VEHLPVHALARRPDSRLQQSDCRAHRIIRSCAPRGTADATFVQWIDARVAKDRELARFYRRRFRPEFQPAFEAWVATRPFTSPDAPLTPFAMPQYKVSEAVQSSRLNAQAGEHANAAEVANQRADNYVLAVVLLASALFFAGISTKMRTLRQREALLALGWVIFLGTAVWLITSPVQV